MVSSISGSGTTTTASCLRTATPCLRTPASPSPIGPACAPASAPAGRRLRAASRAEAEAQSAEAPSAQPHRAQPTKECRGVCSSQGSEVILVQSQRRQQFPKNSVVSPRGRRGSPVPLLTRKERIPGQPPALTHTLTHSHTHARCNTHAAASCRYTRSTSATLQSCTPRVRAPTTRLRVAGSLNTSEGGVASGTRHPP
jgi:hypothetical protein